MFHILLFFVPFPLQKPCFPPHQHAFRSCAPLLHNLTGTWRLSTLVLCCLDGMCLLGTKTIYVLKILKYLMVQNWAHNNWRPHWKLSRIGSRTTFGQAVWLLVRRSWFRWDGPALLFRWDWSWNLLCGHSLFRWRPVMTISVDRGR